MNFLLVLTLLGASPAETSSPGKFHVVGYLPDYRMASFDPAMGRSLTDLVYFSVKPSPTGELDTVTIKAEDLQRLRKVKDQSKVSLLLTVGGWGRSQGFAALAASARARRRFVSSATKFCLDNHFDGIDLDWEHPKDAAEQNAYATLLAEIKRGLAPHKLQLTVALAGWQVLPEAG